MFAKRMFLFVTPKDAISYKEIGLGVTRPYVRSDIM